MERGRSFGKAKKAVKLTLAQHHISGFYIPRPRARINGVEV